MSSPEAYDAISSRLEEWTDTPVVYEDPNYQLPDVPASFVFVEIYGTNFEQETIGAPGNNQWLEQGTALLHVMTPSGTGSRQARVYAKALCDLFRERPADGINVEEMEIGKGGPGAEFPNYWAMTAALYWYRREFTTPTP